MSIKITTAETEIAVVSPYDAEFVSAARQLGGKWDRSRGAWIFAPRDLDLVKAALVDAYGHDGSPQPSVELLVSLDNVSSVFKRLEDRLVVGSIEVLAKRNRDQAPRLGQGCVVVAGRLKDRGGSRNNPMITFEPGTQIRVANVPQSVAQALVDKNPDAYQILETEPAPDATPADASALSQDEQDLIYVLQAMSADRRALVLAKLEEALAK